VMNFRHRSALVAIAGLVSATAASAAIAATPTMPAYYGPPSKNNPVAKPGAIVYTGDGSEFFGGAKHPHGAANLHWTTWNGSEGLGSGYQWINNCTPSCAGGKFSLYPVTLKVYRPKHESKYFIFTRLKVTYTGKKPDHKSSFTWTLSYARGFFQIG
jgi:hypothetical protein